MEVYSHQKRLIILTSLCCFVARDANLAIVHLFISIYNPQRFFQNNRELKLTYTQLCGFEVLNMVDLTFKTFYEGKNKNEVLFQLMNP